MFVDNLKRRMRMRKLSHISVAKFILDTNGMEKLYSHRKSFYMGSVLPDCVPSFLVRKHCIESTFDLLKKEIRKVTEEYDVSKGINTSYCRHLGVIIHYIADYFTFPHNRAYWGSLREHFVYEKKLKMEFLEYVKSDAAKRNRKKVPVHKTVNEIMDYIKEKHDEYVLIMKEIKVDCHYIVELCFSVVDAILYYVESKEALKLARVEA